MILLEKRSPAEVAAGLRFRTAAPVPATAATTAALSARKLPASALIIDQALVCWIGLLVKLLLDVNSY